MPKKLHRHAQAEVEHNEEELRYYRPQGFLVPDHLAGLPLQESRGNGHRDRYFDGLRKGSLVLRSGGYSLRVRAKNDGIVVATFKAKNGADKGARSVRAETEGPITCPCEGAGCLVCQANDNYVALVANGQSLALEKARAVAGKTPLTFMFSIANDRVDHHYRSEHGHVVLSEDYVTYPDASIEHRIEVEHVQGNPDLLDTIDRQLCVTYPHLSACKRGKLSEGRRRMASLLLAG
jgi:hypothetical protein